MFMSVDLPAPFSPSRACTSPTRTSKSTLSLATTPGKRLTIPRISTARAVSVHLDGKGPREPLMGHPGIAWLP